MPEAAEDNKTQDLLHGRPDLKKALYAIAQKVYGWDKAERRAEVLEARQQRFYFRGVQYIFWNEVYSCYMVPSSGGALRIGSTAIDMPRYTDAYNIYGPYGRSLIAAFTQNQPGVRFQAKNPKDGKANTAKAEYERYRHYFDQSNDNKKLQMDLARLYYTDGRAVTYTRFDEKQEREISEAFGTLETKGPMRARSIADCPYFIISREIEEIDAKNQNPDHATEIRPVSTSLGDDYERIARLGILANGRGTVLSADSDTHLCTEHWIWFRPAVFILAGKEKKEGNAALADELKQIFPEGCFLKFIGSVYCGSKRESMDSCLEMSHPLPGDGLNRPSLGQPIVVLQDTTNDSYNLWKETYDYCIPVTYFNSKNNDIEALRWQTSEPGNHIPFSKPTGESMEEQFHTETPAQVTQDFIAFVQDVRGPFAQFSSGALPSLWGGEMPDQKTASGYAMAREQAMGQMGLPWGAMQRHFASIYMQAANIARKMREDETLNIKLPGQRGVDRVEELSFHNMNDGEVLCFPDVDSSFPETFSAKRMYLMQFLSTLGPAAMPFFQTPNNIEQMLELMGVEDVDAPGATACEWERVEIGRLLEESPVPDEDAFAKARQAWMVQVAAAKAGAQTTGQPEPELPPEPQQSDFLKTSRPVDPKVTANLHAFLWQEAQSWLMSPEGEDAAANNPEGYRNVYLQAMQLQELADQQQANQGEQKPPSASINFKDLPLDGQVQLAAKAGITLNPQMAASAAAGAAA